MSEKHLSRHENSNDHENIEVSDQEKQLLAQKAEQAEQAKQEKANENLAKIHELAKQEAEQSHKVAVETTTTDDNNIVGLQHSLKATAYERTLSKARQKLPKLARAFSVVSHNAVVEKVSTVSAQTAARPSGLLGGSISAFLGSVIILYFSRHYGFRYNYLVLFILFIGGFLLGVVLELLVWLFYSRKRRQY